MILAALDDQTLQPALDIISKGARPGRQENGWPLSDEELRAAFEKHPQQGGYIMVRADRIEQLKPWEKVLGAGAADRLAQLSRKHAAFIQALPRSGVTGKPSMVYVFVARQPSDFGRLAQQFVDASAPFDLLPVGP